MYDKVDVLFDGELLSRCGNYIKKVLIWEVFIEDVEF